mgnify:CR=1 FL=1
MRRLRGRVAIERDGGWPLRSMVWSFPARPRQDQSTATEEASSTPSRSISPRGWRRSHFRTWQLSIDAEQHLSDPFAVFVLDCYGDRDLAFPVSHLIRCNFHGQIASCPTGFFDREGPGPFSVAGRALFIVKMQKESLH